MNDFGFRSEAENFRVNAYFCIKYVLTAGLTKIAIKH